MRHHMCWNCLRLIYSGIEIYIERQWDRNVCMDTCCTHKRFKASNNKHFFTICYMILNLLRNKLNLHLLIYIYACIKIDYNKLACNPICMDWFYIWSLWKIYFKLLKYIVFILRKYWWVSPKKRWTLMNLFALLELKANSWFKNYSKRLPKKIEKAYF